MRAFPKLENASLTLIQGNKYMLDFRFNTHSYFPESGSRKHFHVSGMRAIDSPHEITPRNMILREKFLSKFFDFRFNTHIYFPESGSEKRFQASGMRIYKISPNRVIFEKNFQVEKT